MDDEFQKMKIRCEEMSETLALCHCKPAIEVDVLPAYVRRASYAPQIEIAIVCKLDAVSSPKANPPNGERVTLPQMQVRIAVSAKTSMED